ncbi:AAA family ATPase [Chromobacterium sp. IIBBL 290-4]|uniref:AAA family ATPase n=1 Tax=Chromobacterium sp. IIBBL 290-4 TaxID=2953890 RepID=UPI0020B89814|nr:AAA family ATPase [Chromobacterium sp. IIBBL 290-4]UTH74803.1 AAA family ATPase [Chromobacterium sp. IIBBL 290-4]
MTIQQLSLNGFRSIRKLTLELDALNVVIGPNGCGKSNLYKAIHLVHAAAEGRLSAALAQEGGIQKAMWAGGPRRGDKARAPKRMILSTRLDDFDYELQLGYPEPSASLFSLDPLVKEESLWLAGHGRRPSTLLLERRNQAAFLSGVDGERNAYPASLRAEESIFGQLAEPHRYPELSQLRETLRNWRFYHEFAVWPGSPLRAPQVGIRSPVLAHDGANLAAAFQTIVEIGDRELLRHVLAEAFPDSHFQVDAAQGRFQMLMQREGLLRPLEAAELSDGTLRFLCLAVALLSPRPPSFLALNEPENSLHPALLPALARLIAEASRYSQIWLTSHSPALAEMIRRHRPLKIFPLALKDGETTLAEEA